MARILFKENHDALIARAVHKYGPDNKWAVASVLINSEVNECAKEIKVRWMQRLEGVDIWAASHCRTALVYEEWDVGSPKPLTLSKTRAQNRSCRALRAAEIIARTSPQSR